MRDLTEKEIVEELLKIPQDKLKWTAKSDYGVNKTSFYKDYSEATSYEDAYYRTMCGLMSGDITPQGHLPVSLEKKQKLLEELGMPFTK